MFVIFGQMVNDPATIKVVSSDIVINLETDEISFFI
jgi:hypothetical protein